MPEEKIEINTDDKIRLEGLLDPGTKKHGVIITHPHPLYGGDMYNNVVEAVMAGYHKKGYSTLRFNFRGVGASTGVYDNGIGEQKDVIAAYGFYLKRGVEQIYLCGYSFGAWINTRISDKINVNSSIMISPPAAMMQFEPALIIPHLKLVLTGSRDEFAPAEMLKQLVADWNIAADIKIIDGADHFFSGYESKLVEIIKEYT
ncbi:MAG: dienelactone hydrolase family protein [Desulfobacterales bacterium]